MSDHFQLELNPAQGPEIFRNLDLALFARLFSRLAGGEYGLAILDLDLTPVSGSDEAVLAAIAGALPETARETPELLALPFLELGAAGTLILSPLAGIEGVSPGLLAALLPACSNPEKLAQLREALGELGSAILQQGKMEYELNDMAEEVAVRYEELNIVYDFGNIIRQYLRGEKLYKTLLQLCVDRLEVDLAVFIHPDENTTTYTTNPSKKFDEIDLLLTRMRSEIFRFVAASKQPMVLNRMDDHRRHYLWTGMPYKFLAAPVIFQKKVKALMVILRDNDGLDFSNSDRKLMEVICEQVGTLIHNEEMYNSLFVFTEQMAGALIEAVDAKDPYTRGHSDRVNYYAMQIGRVKKLSETELQTLYWSSLLHDLGKIAVPDMVLSKMGKLDEDEYTLMKIHPDRGYDILKNIIQLQKSLPGVRHHHEQFDGNGYPHGLVGVDIPLHARIIAVADTYDAITSSRSYRPARTHEQAMAIIDEVAGSQLDPDLVEIWKELLSNYPEIYLKNLAFHQRP